ncbi:hypothetical protein NEOLEDRAFT_1059816 [Neolentinus lepideus HHB14362 ss-1]|uniref:Oxo-4-hydroxy-4-carboxy-5-ureidoimidazoline decarboxylase domain-containing protein n=1 Tax=Neolentinus lepideus HHB14362 ss-1 TaxID=1314782 RepID=A0A165U991_9AGAM|nr:hypothetical protein NEOLEDRAFT_1059816 [Neolentinus lepideus HHB14362 ss-1]
MAADSSLPPLSLIISSTPESTLYLSNALALLFEPSTLLFSDLIPELEATLRKPTSAITTYTALIDKTLEIIRAWPDELKAKFVGAHPRIGEVKGLSAFSAKEQGQANGNAGSSVAATSPMVLERLAHLNACYERRYPGLRYITFVNGRSRAVIAEEMEGVLGIPHSLSLDQPPAEALGVVEVGSAEWRSELNRAVEDVGRIAKSRLSALGMQ